MEASQGQGWRPEEPRAGFGFLGWGQPAPSSPARESGSLAGAVSSPSGVREGAGAAKGFSRILNNQNDLSGQQDYGPLAKCTFLASWLSDRARARARTKMAVPRPYLVYS